MLTERALSEESLIPIWFVNIHERPKGVNESRTADCTPSGIEGGDIENSKRVSASFFLGLSRISLEFWQICISDSLPLETPQPTCVQIDQVVEYKVGDEVTQDSTLQPALQKAQGKNQAG